MPAGVCASRPRSAEIAVAIWDSRRWYCDPSSARSARHCRAPGCAVDGAVGDDVVAVQMLDDGSFEPVAHTVAGCPKSSSRCRETAPWRSSENSSSCGPSTTRIGPLGAGSSMRLFGRTACGLRLRVRRLVAAALAKELPNPARGIDREAAEGRLALDAAFNREIAEGAPFGEADVECLAFSNES